MIILKLYLKGAIGLKLGSANLEEVNLVFNKPSIDIYWDNKLKEELNAAPFNDGLIAITGVTGSGKTTILDNMHFYLQTVFREGLLEDQFYLSDSERYIVAEHKGKIYEARIKIDAVKRSAETYLKENGIPVKGTEEGKKTPYKEAVIKIFGEPLVFFNAMFSAQKARGVAGMSEGDRRKLYNEILNLLSYEVKHKLYKSKRDALEGKIESLDTEIRVLRADSDKIEEVKTAILEAEKKRASLYNNLSEHKLKQEATSKLLVESDNKKKDYERLAVRNKEIKEEISAKLQRKIELSKNLQDELNLADTMHDEKVVVFQRDNHYDAKIAELTAKRESEKATYEAERIANESAKVDLEIKEIQIKSDIAAAEEQSTRLEKISGNKPLIIEKTARIKALRETLEANNNAQVVCVTKKQKYSDEKSIIVSHLTPLIIKKESVEEKITSLESEISKILKNSEIINTVPCTEEIGKGCLFLKNAYEAKINLPTLQQELLTKEGEKSILLNEIDTLKKSIEELDKKINLVNGEIEKLVNATSEINKEYQVLVSERWEEISKEAEEAEATIRVVNEKISGLSNSLIEIRNSLQKTNIQQVNSEEKLNKFIKDIEIEIESQLELKQKEFGLLSSNYTEKRNKLQEDFNGRIAEIEKEINILSAKIDHTTADKIQELNTSIELYSAIFNEAAELIKTTEASLLVAENEITGATTKLALYQSNEDKATAKEAEKKCIQSDIKEYNFLVKAYSKTGIPILKLENSAEAITNKANELLKIYNNDLKMRIRTLAPTADKKSVKEAFDILVIDSKLTQLTNAEGCDIKMKSGGQQDFLETVVQLATASVANLNGMGVQSFMLDEKDGSLDSSTAMYYMQMIEAIHRDNNIFNTFVISHRQEILDMIPQQIRVEEGNISIINKGAM